MIRDPRQLDLYRRQPDPGIAALDHSSDRLTIDRIAAVIGREATIALMVKFGGTRLYIPRRPREIEPTSSIVFAIGWDLAQKLGDAFGGESIVVPLHKSRAARRRDRAEIIRLHREGITVASIARQVGCSERHVYNVLSNPLK